MLSALGPRPCLYREHDSALYKRGRTREAFNTFYINGAELKNAPVRNFALLRQTGRSFGALFVGVSSTFSFWLIRLRKNVLLYKHVTRLIDFCLVYAEPIDSLGRYL